MSSAIRHFTVVEADLKVRLYIATVVAAIAFSPLPALGQEGRNLPEAPSIGFFGSYRVANEKMDPSKLPIIGAWRINFDRSDPALKLANRFKDTGTLIYTAEKGGIKQEVFLYWPPAKVDYKNVFTDDAREFWFWLVDRNTIYRERATKGVVDERVMYRVAPDGNTLVWTNFNAEGNSGHQVWNRIPMPQR